MSPYTTAAVREHQRWKRSVLLVYNRLRCHTYASHFLHPITDKYAPEYSVIVKQPMDLTTVRRNVSNGTIRTTAQFERDILLIVTNAMMYNRTGHTVFNIAQNFFEEVKYELDLLKVHENQENIPPEPRAKRHLADYNESVAKRLRSSSIYIYQSAAQNIKSRRKTVAADIEYEKTNSILPKVSSRRKSTVELTKISKKEKKLNLLNPSIERTKRKSVAAKTYSEYSDTDSLNEIHDVVAEKDMLLTPTNPKGISKIRKIEPTEINAALSPSKYNSVAKTTKRHLAGHNESVAKRLRSPSIYQNYSDTSKDSRRSKANDSYCSDRYVVVTKLEKLKGCSDKSKTEKDKNLGASKVKNRRLTTAEAVDVRKTNVGCSDKSKAEKDKNLGASKVKNRRLTTAEAVDVRKTNVGCSDKSKTEKDKNLGASKVKNRRLTTAEAVDVRKTNVGCSDKSKAEKDKNLGASKVKNRRQTIAEAIDVRKTRQSTACKVNSRRKSTASNKLKVVPCMYKSSRKSAAQNIKSRRKTVAADIEYEKTNSILPKVSSRRKSTVELTKISKKEKKLNLLNPSIERPRRKSVAAKTYSDTDSLNEIHDVVAEKDMLLTPKNPKGISKIRKIESTEINAALSPSKYNSVTKTTKRHLADHNESVAKRLRSPSIYQNYSDTSKDSRRSKANDSYCSDRYVVVTKLEKLKGCSDKSKTEKDKNLGASKVKNRRLTTAEAVDVRKTNVGCSDKSKAEKDKNLGASKVKNRRQTIAEAIDVRKTRQSTASKVNSRRKSTASNKLKVVPCMYKSPRKSAAQNIKSRRKTVAADIEYEKTNSILPKVSSRRKSTVELTKISKKEKKLNLLNPSIERPRRKSVAAKTYSEYSDTDSLNEIHDVVAEKDMLLTPKNPKGISKIRKIESTEIDAALSHLLKCF